jgi:hypothetical protein
MNVDRPRLRDDIDGDVRALDDLSYHWGPFWSFSVRYGREGPVWKATPADDSTPMTAVSAELLRSMLRGSAERNRAPRHG